MQKKEKCIYVFFFTHRSSRVIAKIINCESLFLAKQQMYAFEMQYGTPVYLFSREESRRNWQHGDAKFVILFYVTSTRNKKPKKKKQKNTIAGTFPYCVFNDILFNDKRNNVAYRVFLTVEYTLREPGIISRRIIKQACLFDSCARARHIREREEKREAFDEMRIATRFLPYRIRRR